MLPLTFLPLYSVYFLLSTHFFMSSRIAFPWDVHFELLMSWRKTTVPKVSNGLLSKLNQLES